MSNQVTQELYTLCRKNRYEAKFCQDKLFQSHYISGTYLIKKIEKASKGLVKKDQHIFDLESLWKKHDTFYSF